MKTKIFWVSLIIIFLIILNSKLVISPPPVVQNINFNEGYEIQFPLFGTLKQDQGFNFSFHVFNISNGIPINNGISCTFHLFSSLLNGDQLSDLTVDTVGASGIDYTFIINSKNFSSSGDYNYIIQCNNSMLGGVESINFKVTPNGIENTTSKSIIYFLPLMLMIITSIMFLIMGFVFEKTGVKLFSLSMAILIIFFAIGFTLKLMQQTNFDFIMTNALFSSFYVLFSILIIGGAFGFILWVLVFVLERFNAIRGYVKKD